MILVDWFYFVSFHLLRILLDFAVVLASPFLLCWYRRKQGLSTDNRKKFKSVLITGGGDGLGSGLVQELVKNDNVKNIIIIGTNSSKLQRIENNFKKDLGTDRKIIIKSIDVGDEELMKSFINEMDKLYSIDLVIANAGVNISTLKDVHYSNAIRGMVNTNILGVTNTVVPMITNFQERKKSGGHIAIVGDLQGYSSIPYNGAYAATKSALRFLADDLRAQCKYWNVGVTFIAPHQIDTKMCKGEHRINDNVTSIEKASKYIINGLYNNEAFIFFPNGEFNKTLLKGTIHPFVHRLFVDDRITQTYAYLHTGRRFEAFGDNDPWH